MNHAPEFTILDFISLANISRCTVQINVTSTEDDFSGYVYIKEGEVWAAWCNGVSGIDAFAKLLWIPSAKANAQPLEEVPAIRSVHEWQHLLTATDRGSHYTSPETSLSEPTSSAWETAPASPAINPTHDRKRYLRLIKPLSTKKVV